MLVSAENHRIKRFVINDMGAFVPKQSLNRIAGYFRNFREWNSYEEAKAYLRYVFIDHVFYLRQ